MHLMQRSHKSFLPLLIFFTSLAIILIALTSEAHPALALTDSKGNQVPAGREEINRIRIPQGWATRPQSDAEAKAKGWSDPIPMVHDSPGGKRTYFYWVRDTEIVPVGAQPLSIPKSVVLKTDVGGVNREVLVPSTRYIYDDGDFIAPDKSNLIGPPFRGLGGWDNLPVPAYSFSDDILNDTYLNKFGKAGNVATFYGRDYDNKEFYYCVNPNALDPDQRDRYFMQSPKYDMQSNYREVPELQYIMAVVMEHAGLNEPDPAYTTARPSFPAAHEALRADYMKMVSDIDNVTDSEPSALDPRLTVGEVRATLKKILGLTLPSVVDGEDMLAVADIDQALGTHDKSEQSFIDIDDTVALGVEYAFGHYMQGMPIADLDKFQGRNGFFGGEVASRSKFGRAFARLIFAYTETAREKGFLNQPEFEYMPLKGTIVSQKQIGDKIELTVSFNQSNDATGYSVIVPEELADKIVITHPTDVLETPSAGKYIFDKASFESGLTIKIDKSITSEDLQKVTFTKKSQSSMIARSYVPQKLYRYDEEAKRWYVREMGIAAKGNRGADQDNHGMAYGQQVIKFNSLVREYSTNLSLQLDLIPQIKTTVSVGAGETKESASAEKPLEKTYTAAELEAGINFDDTVAYKALDKTKQYRFVTVLQELGDNTESTTPVAVQVSEPFTPADSTSDTEYAQGAEQVVRFDKVKNLKAGKTYVVYEYLFAADEQLKTTSSSKNIDSDDKKKALAKHENPADKSQTLVVKEKKSTPAEAQISVKKILSGRPFADGDSFTFKLAAGDSTNPMPAAGSESVTVTDGNAAQFGKITFTKPGTYTYNVSEVVPEEKLENVTYATDPVQVTITVVDKNGALEATVQYPQNKAAVEVTNTYTPPTPTPTEQSLKTTVKANESTASESKEATAPAGEVSVVDTVSYKGLEVGKEYVLKAELMENGTKAIKTVYHTFTPTSADGEEAVDFGKVTLKAGNKYVVFESAIKTEDADKSGEGKDATYKEKESKKWIEHKDASDKAQAVVVEEPTPTPTPTEQSLKTTVKAGDSTASETKEATATAGEVSVVDTVAYKGLEANKEYVLKAELMENGTKAVQTVYHTFTPANADGEEAVDFGKVTLEAGNKYVVFESAIKTEDADKSGEGKDATYKEKESKKWIEHKDATDKAQTVVVENETPTPTPAEQSLKTTVKAGDSTASNEKEATATAGEVSVVDTVAYKGLEANKEYVLKAELMENGTKAIKTVYHTFTPANADGEEAVDFGKVTLKAGNKYVVFESAIKTEDADKSGEGKDATYKEKESKKWIEHKDASDKAQTVVVEKPDGTTPPPPEVPDKPGTPDPNPPTPPAPNIPNKPGNPDPNKPNNPTPPAPNTPEKPGWPTPDVPEKPGQPKIRNYVPKTADQVPVAGFVSIALASVLGLCGLVGLRREG